MGRRRNYTREFKLEVVSEVVAGHKSIAQICRKYELAESVIRRWKKEYELHGEAAFTEARSTATNTPSGKEAALEARIAELERFCGQLALENRVLKKALRSAPSRRNTP